MRRPSLPQLVLGSCITASLLIWGHRPTRLLIAGGESVDGIARRMGARVQERLEPRFQAAGAVLPPSAVRLVGFKREKRLELWVKSTGSAEDVEPWTFVHSYKVKAASGVPGPKLREGDGQVPEGLYGLEYLNPNSKFHLSMKVSYPNAFDLARAGEDGRAEPGSDIFIHGKSRSVGCLAIGDEPIEELFVLAATVGLDAISVVLAPYDPEPRKPLLVPDGAPPWTDGLYRSIDEALAATR
ncbi:MAG: hypothetical protein ACJAZN_000477 [Planctomycetota bacterium]|jgi:hypothetical protein